VLLLTTMMMSKKTIAIFAYDAMTDQVVKFVSKVKIQNFQKAQNDPQMTSK
jgi:hypothetical protein